MNGLSQLEPVHQVLSLWRPGTAVSWSHGDSLPPVEVGWFAPDELAEVAERLLDRHPERVYDADEQAYVDEQRLECEIRGQRFAATRHVDHEGRLLSVAIDDL